MNVYNVILNGQYFRQVCATSLKSAQRTCDDLWPGTIARFSHILS